MNATIAWKPPRSAISANFGGLLDRLVTKHNIQNLGHTGFMPFMNGPGNGVVLLAEEPDTAAESWDMAVLFPELLTTIGTDLRAAVMRPDEARPIQQRFAVARLPAFLFVRDGGYVGAIEGLRDWSEFVTEFTAMLQKPVSRVPVIGIAVIESTSSCH